MPHPPPLRLWQTSTALGTLKTAGFTPLSADLIPLRQSHGPPWLRQLVGAGGNELASLKRETRFAAGFPVASHRVKSVTGGGTDGGASMRNISIPTQATKPQPELRVQQCRGDRRGHGPPVAATATARLGLRACSGPSARPTGRAHLPAGRTAPGRILPCPCFSGVGLPILGASSGEQLAFDGLRLRRP